MILFRSTVEPHISSTPASGKFAQSVWIIHFVWVIHCAPPWHSLIQYTDTHVHGTTCMKVCHTVPTYIAGYRKPYLMLCSHLCTKTKPHVSQQQDLSWSKFEFNFSHTQNTKHSWFSIFSKLQGQPSTPDIQGSRKLGSG